MKVGKSIMLKMNRLYFYTFIVSYVSYYKYLILDTFNKNDQTLMLSAMHVLSPFQILDSHQPEYN